MLEVNGVTKRYRTGTFGVREMSLSASAGVLGLLGPNGAGKTTLMQMLATLSRPTSGTIRFQGRDVVAEPERVRERLGYLPQDFGVPDGLTAFELVDYVARLKGVKNRSRVLSLLETVGLGAVASRPVATFSGGMRQRVGIAQALVGDPELLIVDEPTAGLDPEERVRFRNLLSELSAGSLVVLSTHVVSDVESVATQIAVVKEGRLLYSGSPDALVRAATGLVWSAVLSPADMERLRHRLVVSSSVLKADGFHLRVVAGEPPVPGAAPAEPDLEDGYLAVVRGLLPAAAAA